MESFRVEICLFAKGPGFCQFGEIPACCLVCRAERAALQHVLKKEKWFVAPEPTPADCFSTRIKPSK